MKIALYELYKALKSKVLLILFVALFLLNLALSATYTPVLGVPDECIREINKVYLSTSEEEKLSVAESIANKYIKDNVLQNIFPDKKYEDKLNRVKNYNTTIRNIKSEAEQRSKPSVFSKENSFTQLSFKDIFTAYNNVIENKPSFYPDYGTERMFKSICDRIKKPASPGTLGILTNPESLYKQRRYRFNDACFCAYADGYCMLSRQNDRHGGGYKTNSQRAYSQCRSKADSLLFAYRYFGCVVIRYGIAYRYYSLRAWRFIKMYSVNPAVYAMQYKYDRGRVSCYPLFIQNISLFYSRCCNDDYMYFP